MVGRDREETKDGTAEGSCGGMTHLSFFQMDALQGAQPPLRRVKSRWKREKIAPSNSGPHPKLAVVNEKAFPTMVSQMLVAASKLIPEPRPYPFLKKFVKKDDDEDDNNVLNHEEANAATKVLLTIQHGDDLPVACPQMTTKDMSAREKKTY